MSNQFYNYISNLLIDYFEGYGLKQGERFYLQLDSEEEVDELIEAFRQHNVNEFTYTHSLGDPYVTFSLTIKDIKLVFAYTSTNVTPDFLVTLRNQVGEQKDVWEGTALFSIVSEQLDSIEGGSSNLQKEGMPLHPASLIKHLNVDIEKSALTKTEQIILLDNLKQIAENHFLQQVTLLDFEEIFLVLQKGKIEERDYEKFGLFRDLELATFKGNKVQDRIQENRELYDYVKKAHDFGSLDDDLDKKFTFKGVQELKKEEWTTTTFSDVARYSFEKKQEIGKTKVELNQVKINSTYTMWRKPQSDTTAGKRKQHIIIFNPNYAEEISLQANFEISGTESKSLSKEYFAISKPSEVSLQVGKVNVNFAIKAYPDKPTFIKIAYKHENKASLGAEFYIAVFPVNEGLLKDLKTKYFVNVKEQCLELEADIEEIRFGEGFDSETIDVQNADEIIQIPEDTEVTIVPQIEAFDEEEQLRMNVEQDGCIISVLLKNDLPESTPITGMRIWKMKRELSQDFQLQNNRLVIENREFYTHKDYNNYFGWENKWVEKGFQYAVLDSEELIPESLELDENLREAYSRFINYFRTKKSIPSLCHYSDDLKKRAKDYVSEFNNQINSIEEGKAPGKKGRHLMRLGLMKSASMIYFTPFHPLVVAYQLRLSEMLREEELDNTILNRLKPDSLIPFIFNETNQLYKPDHQSDALEWIVFKPVREVTVSDASHYLAKVVQEKISQFKEHFNYLFINDSKAPVKLNVINITNDLEVLKGIVNWLVDEIEKNGPDQLKPVEVSLYLDLRQQSAFDEFSRLDSVEEVKSFLKLKFKSSKYDENDIVRFIRESLFYYKKDIKGSYQYAHISFYKMYAQDHDALQPMSDMITGISLDGIVSTVPSMKGQENYRSGFGIKGIKIDDNDLLLSTAYYVNELAANMRNEGNDTYRKGESIVSRTATDDEETLSKIFASSYWVTFIDPSVDLEFFQKYDRNLVVIHYNDQYTSSSRYDAITVTDKSNQFNAVIKEFLVKKNVEVTESNVNHTIKAFNTFNGEWLLRIVGSKGHFEREKLSIISAIKYSLAFFNHPNILWVPISLEEILRVAGAVSLNKKEGVFSAKNLGVTGKHSDDLLLVGLELGDELKLHYYPVEVKIGINSSAVIEKAKSQLHNTRMLFDRELSYKEVNGKQSFKNLFYRNFFVQIFIANAKKMEQSNVWPEKDYFLSEEVIEKLLTDDYEVSMDLKTIIGDGAVLSFQKDAFIRSASLEDHIMVVNLTEDDGYSGIVESVEKLTSRIQSGKTDFAKGKLIAYNYKFSKNDVDMEYEDTTEEITEATTENQNTAEETSEPNSDSESTEESPVKALNDHTDEPKNNLGKIRILLGKVHNSNREIYWEYGNPDLANRHLLISGKSGQGKTYFMQCLLMELSNQGVSNIIIDYTEGFLPNQLEPEFTERIGSKLTNSIVYSEGFPINPFKKNDREIGGLKLPESATDVAERIKSVFSAVYKSLGIQQLNAIYEATLVGLNKYGDSMDLQKLRAELEVDGSSYAKTALSQIRPLIDRNPFKYESELDWKKIIEGNGQVFIVQLTGFPRDVQLIITEFILWDLWNYSVRNGNKSIPMPVVMDEAQNLDHTEKSPSARILTEGRKFGWSAWYATQFLKSQLSADELARLQNSSQKIYFAPPEQELSHIASSLTQNPNDKKEWEKKLASLKKGQCVVQGPILDDRGELTQPVVSIVDITPLGER